MGGGGGVGGASTAQVQVISDASDVIVNASIARYQANKAIYCDGTTGVDGLWPTRGTPEHPMLTIDAAVTAALLNGFSCVVCYGGHALSVDAQNMLIVNNGSITGLAGNDASGSTFVGGELVGDFLTGGEVYVYNARLNGSGTISFSSVHMVGCSINGLLVFSVSLLSENCVTYGDNAIFAPGIGSTAWIYGYMGQASFDNAAGINFAFNSQSATLFLENHSAGTASIHIGNGYLSSAISCTAGGTLNLSGTGYHQNDGSNVINDIRYRQLQMMEFSGIPVDVFIAAAPANANLSDVIAVLPAYATVIRADVAIDVQSAEDTSGATNAIVTVGNMVRIKTAAGVWGVDDILAVGLINTSYRVVAGGGNQRNPSPSQGSLNVSAVVNGSGTYNIRFDQVAAAGASLVLRAAVARVRIWFYT